MGNQYKIVTLYPTYIYAIGTLLKGDKDLMEPIWRS